MPHSIAQNTAFLTLASVGQKMIAFVYFTIIARTLGPEQTGLYTTALALTTIFVVFVDLGLTNVLVREAAKYRDNIQKYFSVILWSKCFLGVVSYFALFFAVGFLGYDLPLRQLVYLSGITMLFDSLHLSLYGVLRALGDMRFEAIGIVVSQALTLLLGGISLYFGLPLIFLILAFTIPSALNVIYVFAVVRVKHGIRLLPRFHPDIFQTIIKIAAPFAIAAVFARVYSYIDTIILSKIAGQAAVGWYAVPYKITFAFQFIPLALVAALYPRLSEYFIKDKKRLALLFQEAMKYLMIIVFPISVGIGILSRDIILIFYTADYLPSVLPLQILVAGLIFSYLSFPIGAFLNACDRQTTQTFIIGLVMVVNIILNIVLIPHYGVAGAAFAALMGNILLTLCGYFIIPRVTAVSHAFFVNIILRLSLSAGIMGVAVYFVNKHAHLVIAILVGAVIYPLMLAMTKTVKMTEFKQTIGLWRS